MKDLHLRSSLSDVAAGLQPQRLALPLELEGANTRLLWLAYHHAQGGRIPDCKGWSVARWYTELGFHPRYPLARLEERGFIRWDGDDLLVLEYILGHERRIRGYCTKQIPAMMAARGFDPTRYGGTAPPSAPPPASDLAMGSQRVNCAKVLKTPTTSKSNYQVQLGRQLTPDRPPDPDPPPLRSDSDSEPPEPPHEDRGRVTERRIEGPRAGVPRARLSAREVAAGGLEDTTRPEGFERWAEAMPLVRKPRSAAAARRWREENLEYWVRYDLEGEADLILEEVERLKHSDAWDPPRFIPSPMNFLRRASWRRRPKVQRPKVWPAPEVFEPATTWAPPEAARDHLASYLRDLAASKGVS
jgi:hypothetical protein